MQLRLEQTAQEKSPLSFAADGIERDIGTDVCEAVNDKRITLAVQPVLSAQSDQTILYHEALIRVLYTGGGVIPTRDIFFAVEDMEIGRKLDCFSLSLGLRELRRNPNMQIGINMSAKSIAYAPWRRILEHGISESRELAKRLTLEITECSAMKMPEIVKLFMEDGRRRGISFALDNFGKETTTLKFLREFMFDFMKIDGSITKNVHKDTDNQVLVEALLRLADSFDMITIAENVEHTIDAEFLIGAGVSAVQGYLFGRPFLVD